MKIHRVGLLAFTLTSVAALASANAADMYRAPEAVGGYKDGPVYVAPWAGFYLGVNGGYASADRQGNIGYSGVGITPDVFPSFDAKGGFGGGQIGYNWQGVWHPRLVLGVETDFQGAGIEDSFRAVTPDGRTIAGKENVDWFGTVRGRLGYAFDRALVYATGGLAYGSVNQRVDVLPIGFTPAFVARNATDVGFVAGGGLEYKIAPAWSLKAEYQYIDLGSDKLTGFNFVDGNSRTTTDVDNKFHTVRAGINYHFIPAYEPLK
jgi:outer membrane immunogenic protein